jgi:hypothetical protein
VKRRHLAGLAVGAAAVMIIAACGSSKGKPAQTTSAAAATSSAASTSSTPAPETTASTSQAQSVVTTTQPPVVVTKTVSAPAAAPAPSFSTLKLTFDKACAPQGGVTTVGAILTWTVVNATGIEVGIDDTNPADATKYSGASGSQEITSVACSGKQAYTFDVWTTGGTSSQPAHKQLTYTSG